VSAVGSGAGNAVPFVLAERRARLAAVTIDDMVVLAACLPAIFGAVPRLSAALADVVNGSEFDPMALLLPLLTGPGAIVSIVALIAVAVVSTWLVGSNGQTIGKRMLGIKIVRKNGMRASLARIFFLRYLLSSAFGWLGYIGLIYQLVDPLLIFQDSRQCLHDRIADTIVIRA
jgi:uncharacterized RDD family membrane protein YckC